MYSSDKFLEQTGGVGECEMVGCMVWHTTAQCWHQCHSVS